MNTAKAASAAIEQAKLAYQFGSGSYTYSALSACLAVQEAIQRETPPDWISEFVALSEAA